MEQNLEETGRTKIKVLCCKEEDLHKKNMDDQLLKQFDHLDGVCDIEKKKNEEENDKAREKVGATGIQWEIDPEKLVIKETFARGAFAYVHRGLYNGQPVAVKVLAWEEEGERNKAMQRDFQREVSVWFMLEHPNITRCFGGTTSKCTCVVTEYLSGGTLKSYLKKFRQKKLPMEDVMQLALDVARGLHYLHSNNIVHRDVKTENLLMDKNHRVKIADFSASCLETSNSSELIGKTGTPGYMAPEVLECKPYDKKCDVYSFGICLWEMYSASELTSDVVYKHLRPEIPKSCPNSLANVMERCWDAEPSKRPEMEEVVTILEEIEAELVTMLEATDNSRLPHGCFWFSMLDTKKTTSKGVYR